MADQKLTVVVGADVTQLEKGVAKAESSLKKFQKSSANTGATLTNLSRIAQDAPFGFIAIQNNITELLPSFQRLSAESGGTGKALKALGASLLGPAGIAVGMSVVISAVTSLTQKYGSLGAAVSAILGLSDGLAQSQMELAKSMSEAGAEASGEGAKLKSLVSILNDTSSSNMARVNTYRELKDTYPGIIQNLSEENALTKQGGELISYRSAQLLQYIRLKGQEKAIISLISKAYEKQLSTLDDLNQLGTIDAIGQAMRSMLQGNTAAGNPFAAATRDIVNAGKSIGFLEGELNKVNKLMAETDRDLFKYKPEKVPSIKTTTEKSKGNGAVYLPIFPDPVSVTNFTATADRLINDQFARSTPVDVPIIPTIPTKALEQFKKFTELQKNIFDKKILDEKIAQVENFANTVGQNLSTLFLNIAANGGKAFQTIGESIKNLVKSLAAAVIKAAAFAVIMAIINPGAKAGSFGARFIGGFAKSLGSGSSIGNPNFGGAGNALGSVQFRLNGSDLVGSIQRTQGRINRVG